VHPPSAPKPPVISEVHSTSCTVTYQPPVDNGGGPTSYLLERRTPGPDSEWIRVNHTPVTDLQYTIDHLTPATEYEFRVAAVNKKHQGDFSPVSLKIMTGETPEKPGHPTVLGVIGTSVCLQWTAPNNNVGAGITEYSIVFWTPIETNDTAVDVDVNMESLISYAVSVAANTEPLINYTIRNLLQSHTRYTFAIAAVNRIGRGPWSDPSEVIMTFDGMLNIDVIMKTL